MAFNMHLRFTICTLARRMRKRKCTSVKIMRCTPNNNERRAKSGRVNKSRKNTPDEEPKKFVSILEGTPSPVWLRLSDSGSAMRAPPGSLTSARARPKFNAEQGNLIPSRRLITPGVVVNWEKRLIALISVTRCAGLWILVGWILLMTVNLRWDVLIIFQTGSYLYWLSPVFNFSRPCQMSRRSIGGRFLFLF